MTIHQLLSASQSSPQTQSHGTFSRQGSPNGFFQQALSQASAAQSLSAPTLSETGSLQKSSPQAQLSTLSSLLSDALEMDSENLSAALEALGLDLSESDLSDLLAQLELPNSKIKVDTLELNGAESATPLDEIAARLALMASFSESSPQAQPESPMAPAALGVMTEQLNINQDQINELASALNALMNQTQNTQPLGNVSTQDASPSLALETVAEQLNISQVEAAQLVSALNGLVAQRQGGQSDQPLPVDTARLTSAPASAMDIQAAPRAQPDTFFAQVNTSAAATSQISSEALMGALMTLEGAPKGSQSSEHLPTGFSLAAGSGPLASTPSAQGFTPTVAPTPAALTTPFTSPAWPQQLGQQLVQISQRGGEQHVQMQLNPAELGPLSISLKFGEQGAQAHFLSAHAQVRQVLEQAIPQLREALAEQGISLGETSVGEQRDPNAQGFAQSGGGRGTGIGSDSGDEGEGEKLSLSAESSPLIIDGRVDLYA
ncbi:flagellar hook-length control protein FliK [Vreelandella indica]|uniref:flagellar hook-length control protein FliK n=1 Tax=Vreelandella indica TaxID=3126500 RepID=UPI00300E02F9